MSNISLSEGDVEESRPRPTPGVMEMTLMEGEEYYHPDDAGTWTQKISDQLCRICAKPNRYLIPIFEGEGIEHQLEPKIQQHLPIEVSENDYLPLQVCYQCASTLIAWSDLVIACVEADRKLHQMCELEETDIKGIELLLDEPILELNEACETASIASDLQSDTIASTIASDKGKKPNRKMVRVKSSTTRHKRKQNLEAKTPAKPIDALVRKMTETEEGNNSPLSAVNGMKEENPLDKAVELQDFKAELEETTQGHLCSSCGKSFTTQPKLRFHENWMHSTKPKKYVCALCGREYQHKAKYHLHLLKHSGTKDIICEVCGKTFYEKTELRQHMTCHSQERPFACRLCDGTFKRRTNLLTHEATMHGVVPEGHRSHACPSCGKTFLVAKLLADHMASHSREVCCPKCGREFLNRSLLAQHTKFSECSSLEEMPESRSCPCKVCGKTFKAKPNLRQHIRKVHEKGKNKFACTKCGQECVGSRSYSYHVKHDCKPWPWKPRSKEPPAEKRTHQCKVCGKVFKANSNLAQHVRKVHEKDKHDKFCCNICGKLFRWKICLDEHIRIHLNLKPCVCKVCNKAFRTWSCLARHKKAHEDRRTFQCQMCGKAFKHSGALRAHLRIHSGIRPHPCGLCDRSFIYYNEKIRHQYKVHSIHIEIKQEETQSRYDEVAASVLAAVDAPVVLT